GNGNVDGGGSGTGGNTSSNAVPYRSQTVTKSAATIGPTTKPTGPNKIKPPSVEIRIIKSGISVSLPTSHGRRKLSTEPTTAPPQTNKPIALPQSPRAAR